MLLLTQTIGRISIYLFIDIHYICFYLHIVTDGEDVCLDKNLTLYLIKEKETYDIL
jgi:hypothetical protein